MPFAIRDGVRLYWREDGHPDLPALLLLNSLGTDHAMWDPVVPALAAEFHVLRMDTRGHGASDAPPGNYTIAMLADDALAVLDAAGAEKAHVCGLSMGGMTVLHLAQSSPGRLDKAVACCTSAKVDPQPWLQRAATVRGKGMAEIVDTIMVRFFSEAYRKEDPVGLATARATFLRLDPQGYAACCVAIGTMGIWDGLAGIGTPLLVVNGAQDAATPPAEHGDRIVAAVPGAQAVSLDAGHIAAMERPTEFAAAVIAFLRDAPGTQAGAKEGAGGSVHRARVELFEHGLAARKAVLGAPWVERSLATRNAFNGEFQEMITRIAWGEIWTRPGLEHRVRRFLVLAITIALGRWEEYRLHVRAGIEQGGYTVDELKEVIMQSAIYAGVPAANTAFREAMEELRALGKLPE